MQGLADSPAGAVWDGSMKASNGLILRCLCDLLFKSIPVFRVGDPDRDTVTCESRSPSLAPAWIAHTENDGLHSASWPSAVSEVSGQGPPILPTSVAAPVLRLIVNNDARRFFFLPFFTTRLA